LKLCGVDGEEIPGELLDFSMPDALFRAESSIEAPLYLDLAVGARTVKTAVRIVREFTDEGKRFYALVMGNIRMEDLRFLVETLYKRPLRDEDMSALGERW
jgi:hypothetical protein